MSATVYLETYGCQMNVLDSELARDQFEALGYRFVEDPSAARVVLLNTCSVRELSEQKVLSQLGRLGIAKRDRSDMVIGVLGCMAEREGPRLLKRMPFVDLLCGPSNLDELPTLVQNALLNRAPGVALAGHTSRRSATLEKASDSLEALDLSRAFSATTHGTQAYVRITRGCNKFCSFCVVPFTRGPEVHRPAQHVIDEVRRLVDTGVLEVTLLGQTVNHYVYKDGGRTTSFADLLWQVHEAVPALPRLRFLTSFPRDFSDDALDAMAQARRICRYLHIPAQSGSNKMLQAMNRGYTVEEYGELLERARARMPDVRLAGDMVVGFPGESDADHAQSIALLRRARYRSCFIFKYSPRPGTVAERRLEDDVPDGVKKARNLELLEVTSEISRELLQASVGRELDVLVEDFSALRRKTSADLVMLPTAATASGDSWVRLRGRATGDEIVAFGGPASLVGKIVRVRAQQATDLTILGEWCDPGPERDSLIAPPSPHS